MFIVLSSWLLYPIMVIQSYITFRDKIHTKKNMNNVLSQNVNVTKKVLNIRYKYHRQFMLTAAV